MLDGLPARLRGPADHGRADRDRHAPGREVGRDRRAGGPAPRRGGRRLRHRRARGGLPADAPPRRVQPHRPRELPLHDPRRRGLRAALDLGGAPVVRRRAARPRRADRRRHHGAARTAAWRSAGSPSYVRDRRVPLEMCPTSNVHTGAAPSIEEHPIDLLRRLRFRVTVNTDNRLMSGITPQLASSRRWRARSASASTTWSG